MGRLVVRLRRGLGCGQRLVLVVLLSARAVLGTLLVSMLRLLLQRLWRNHRMGAVWMGGHDWLEFYIVLVRESDKEKPPALTPT